MLGLEPTKGLDLVLDEKNGVVAIQSEKECRKTKFGYSLVPVNLFFTMFNSLTEYEGLDHDGLKKFKLKQFEENESTPKFYFLFDDDNTFKRSRIMQKDYGQYDFDAVINLEGKSFGNDDWYAHEECVYIEDTILEESGELAGFMWQLVKQVAGMEEDILTFLGYSPDANPLKSKYDGDLYDDEAFDEED